ncbi:GA module-containing protein [Mycoplasma sp. NEAQ87857]|uniref:GA module-containing protein n=1 Tax=Mycoplasma sp. NEAQ87857 TaxID=2683967 RepID=UPI00131EB07A|nr:GA module-containing protein [Mycoplasma sp. NEAQ87857]
MKKTKLSKKVPFATITVMSALSPLALISSSNDNYDAATKTYTDFYGDTLLGNKYFFDQNSIDKYVELSNTRPLFDVDNTFYKFNKQYIDYYNSGNKDKYFKEYNENGKKRYLWSYDDIDGISTYYKPDLLNNNNSQVQYLKDNILKNYEERHNLSTDNTTAAIREFNESSNYRIIHKSDNFDQEMFSTFADKTFSNQGAAQLVRVVRVDDGGLNAQEQTYRFEFGMNVTRFRDRAWKGNLTKWNQLMRMSIIWSNDFEPVSHQDVDVIWTPADNNYQPHFSGRKDFKFQLEPNRLQPLRLNSPDNQYGLGNQGSTLFKYYGDQNKNGESWDNKYQAVHWNSNDKLTFGYMKLINRYQDLEGKIPTNNYNAIVGTDVKVGLDTFLSSSHTGLRPINRALENIPIDMSQYARPLSETFGNALQFSWNAKDIAPWEQSGTNIYITMKFRKKNFWHPSHKINGDMSYIGATNLYSQDANSLHNAGYVSAANFWVHRRTTNRPLPVKLVSNKANSTDIKFNLPIADYNYYQSINNKLVQVQGRIKDPNQDKYSVNSNREDIDHYVKSGITFHASSFKDWELWGPNQRETGMYNPNENQQFVFAVPGDISDSTRKWIFPIDQLQGIGRSVASLREIEWNRALKATSKTTDRDYYNAFMGGGPNVNAAPKIFNEYDFDWNDFFKTTFNIQKHLDTKDKFLTLNQKADIIAKADSIIQNYVTEAKDPQNFKNTDHIVDESGHTVAPYEITNYSSYIAKMKAIESEINDLVAKNFSDLRDEINNLEYLGDKFKKEFKDVLVENSTVANWSLETAVHIKDNAAALNKKAKDAYDGIVDGNQIEFGYKQYSAIEKAQTVVGVASKIDEARYRARYRFSTEEPKKAYSDAVWKLFGLFGYDQNGNRHQLVHSPELTDFNVSNIAPVINQIEKVIGEARLKFNLLNGLDAIKDIDKIAKFDLFSEELKEFYIKEAYDKSDYNDTNKLIAKLIELNGEPNTNRTGKPLYDANQWLNSNDESNTRLSNNYKYADTNNQNAYNKVVSDLKALFDNDKKLKLLDPNTLERQTTKEQLDVLMGNDTKDGSIAKAKHDLNGDANLKDLENKIDSLQHLSDWLKSQYKSWLTTRYEKIAGGRALWEKLPPFDQALVRLIDKLKEYKSKENDVVYTRSTNKALVDAKANEIKTKFQNGANSDLSNLSSFKYNVDNTATETDAITSAFDALLRAMDGKEVFVREKQAEINNLHHFSDNAKNKFKGLITKEASVNDINNLINKLKDLDNQSNDLTTNLTDAKKLIEGDTSVDPTKLSNYNNASDGKKNDVVVAYDNFKDKINENGLYSDKLFNNLDNANKANSIDTIKNDLNSAKETLNTAINNLDGNTRLATKLQELKDQIAKAKTISTDASLPSEAKTELDNLINSVESTLESHKTNINELEKDIEKVKDAIAKAQDAKDNSIDQDKTDAKTTIEALTHLSTSAKKHFTDAIDKATSRLEIRNKLKEAQDLNDTYASLIPILTEAYNKIGQNKDSNEFLNSSDDKQKAYKDALAALNTSVIENINTTNNILGVSTDKTNVISLISNLSNAINDLDGNDRLAKLKQKAKDKINSLTHLNNGQKDHFINQIDRANLLTDIDPSKDIDAVTSGSIIDTASKLNDKMQELNNYLTTELDPTLKNRTSENYKFANNDKKNKFDQVLDKALDLTSTNSDNNANITQVEKVLNDLRDSSSKLDGSIIINQARSNLDQAIVQAESLINNNEIDDEFLEELNNAIDQAKANKTTYVDDIDKLKEAALELNQATVKTKANTIVKQANKVIKKLQDAKLNDYVAHLERLTNELANNAHSTSDLSLLTNAINEIHNQIDTANVIFEAFEVLNKITAKANDFYAHDLTSDLTDNSNSALTNGVKELNDAKNNLTALINVSNKVFDQTQTANIKSTTSDLKAKLATAVANLTTNSNSKTNLSANLQTIFKDYINNSNTRYDNALSAYDKMNKLDNKMIEVDKTLTKHQSTNNTIKYILSKSSLQNDFDNNINSLKDLKDYIKDEIVNKYSNLTTDNTNFDNYLSKLNYVIKNIDTSFNNLNGETNLTNATNSFIDALKNAFITKKALLDNGFGVNKEFKDLYNNLTNITTNNLIKYLGELNDETSFNITNISLNINTKDDYKKLLEDTNNLNKLAKKAAKSCLDDIYAQYDQFINSLNANEKDVIKNKNQTFIQEKSIFNVRINSKSNQQIITKAKKFASDLSKMKLEVIKYNAKAEINSLENLDSSLKTAINNQFDSKTDAIEINKVKQNANKLNEAYNDLKATIIKYNQAKANKLLFNNSDQNLKDNADNAYKVIAEATNPYLNDLTNINSAKGLIDNLADVQSKTKALNDAVDALNGLDKLANFKDSVKAKVDALTHLNNAQKEAFKTQIDQTSDLSTLVGSNIDLNNVQEGSILDQAHKLDTAMMNLNNYLNPANDNDKANSIISSYKNHLAIEYKYASTQTQDAFDLAVNTASELLDIENGANKNIAQVTEILNNLKDAKANMEASQAKFISDLTNDLDNRLSNTIVSNQGKQHLKDNIVKAIFNLNSDNAKKDALDLKAKAIDLINKLDFINSKVNKVDNAINNNPIFDNPRFNEIAKEIEAELNKTKTDIQAIINNWINGDGSSYDPLLDANRVSTLELNTESNIDTTSNAIKNINNKLFNLLQSLKNLNYNAANRVVKSNLVYDYSKLATLKELLKDLIDQNAIDQLNDINFSNNINKAIELLTTNNKLDQFRTKLNINATDDLITELNKQLKANNKFKEIVTSVLNINPDAAPSDINDIDNWVNNIIDNNLDHTEFIKHLASYFEDVQANDIAALKSNLIQAIKSGMPNEATSDAHKLKNSLILDLSLPSLQNNLDAKLQDIFNTISKTYLKNTINSNSFNNLTIDQINDFVLEVENSNFDASKINLAVDYNLEVLAAKIKLTNQANSIKAQLTNIDPSQVAIINDAIDQMGNNAFNDLNDNSDIDTLYKEAETKLVNAKSNIDQLLTKVQSFIDTLNKAIAVKETPVYTNAYNYLFGVKSDSAAKQAFDRTIKEILENNVISTNDLNHKYLAKLVNLNPELLFVNNGANINDYQSVIKPLQDLTDEINQRINKLDGLTLLQEFKDTNINYINKQNSFTNELKDALIAQSNALDTNEKLYSLYKSLFNLSHKADQLVHLINLKYSLINIYHWNKNTNTTADGTNLKEAINNYFATLNQPNNLLKNNLVNKDDLNAINQAIKQILDWYNLDNNNQTGLNGTNEFIKEVNKELSHLYQDSINNKVTLVEVNEIKDDYLAKLTKAIKDNLAKTCGLEDSLFNLNKALIGAKHKQYHRIYNEIKFLEEEKANYTNTFDDIYENAKAKAKLKALATVVDSWIDDILVDPSLLTNNLVGELNNAITMFKDKVASTNSINDQIAKLQALFEASQAQFKDLVDAKAKLTKVINLADEYKDKVLNNNLKDQLINEMNKAKEVLKTTDIDQINHKTNELDNLLTKVKAINELDIAKDLLEKVKDDSKYQDIKDTLDKAIDNANSKKDSNDTKELIDAKNDLDNAIAKTNLDKTITDAKDLIKELEKENPKYKDIINDLNKVIDNNSNTNTKDIIDATKDLAKEIDNSKAKKTIIDANNVIDEINKLPEDLIDKDTINSDLNNKIKELDKLINDKDASSKDINNAIKDLEKAITDAKAKIDKAKYDDSINKANDIINNPNIDSKIKDDLKDIVDKVKDNINKITDPSSKDYIDAKEILDNAIEKAKLNDVINQIKDFINNNDNKTINNELDKNIKDSLDNIENKSTSEIKDAREKLENDLAKAKLDKAIKDAKELIKELAKDSPKYDDLINDLNNHIAQKDHIDPNDTQALNDLANKINKAIKDIKANKAIIDANIVINKVNESSIDQATKDQIVDNINHLIKELNDLKDNNGSKDDINNAIDNLNQAIKDAEKEIDKANYNDSVAKAKEIINNPNIKQDIKDQLDNELAKIDNDLNAITDPSSKDYIDAKNNLDKAIEKAKLDDTINQIKDFIDHSKDDSTNSDLAKNIKDVLDNIDNKSTSEIIDSNNKLQNDLAKAKLDQAIKDAKELIKELAKDSPKYDEIIDQLNKIISKKDTLDNTDTNKVNDLTKEITKTIKDAKVKKATIDANDIIAKVNDSSIDKNSKDQIINKINDLVKDVRDTNNDNSSITDINNALDNLDQGIKDAEKDINKAKYNDSVNKAKDVINNPIVDTDTKDQLAKDLKEIDNKLNDVINPSAKDYCDAKAKVDKAIAQSNLNNEITKAKQALDQLQNNGDFKQLPNNFVKSITDKINNLIKDAEDTLNNKDVSINDLDTKAKSLKDQMDQILKEVADKINALTKIIKDAIDKINGSKNLEPELIQSIVDKAKNLDNEQDLNNLVQDTKDLDDLTGVFIDTLNQAKDLQNDDLYNKAPIDKQNNLDLAIDLSTNNNLLGKTNKGNTLNKDIIKDTIAQLQKAINDINNPNSNKPWYLIPVGILGSLAFWVGAVLTKKRKK